MGLFDTIGTTIEIWLVLMAIGIPIILIRSFLQNKKINDDVKEISKGLDLFDDMYMNSGSCSSCVYRDGDHTKLAGSEIVYCYKLNKEVNWIDEEFSREHPCPYFEGDKRLLTRRR